jgi:ech hydrogenase subunit F
MPPLKMSMRAAKGLFQRPVTRRYPFEKRTYYPATRGALVLDAAKCTLCVLCEKKCPTHALKVDRAGKTWAIERLKCISCGYCVEACPRKCLVLENQYAPCVTEKKQEVIPVPYTPPQKPAAPAAPKAEGA